MIWPFACKGLCQIINKCTYLWLRKFTWGIHHINPLGFFWQLWHHIENATFGQCRCVLERWQIRASQAINRRIQQGLPIIYRKAACCTELTSFPRLRGHFPNRAIRLIGIMQQFMRTQILDPTRAARVLKISGAYYHTNCCFRDFTCAKRAVFHLPHTNGGIIALGNHFNIEIFQFQVHGHIWKLRQKITQHRDKCVKPKSVATDTHSIPVGADCIELTKASASPASFSTRRAQA